MAKKSVGDSGKARKRGPDLETLVMSGGAPVSPLMAGFLAALWERKKTFKSFHTSGAGALMALLFLAPKDRDPGDALRNWVERGVADEIYRSLPVNFKLFRKPGPFAPLFHQLAARFKIPVGTQPTTVSSDPFRDLFARWFATSVGTGGSKDTLDQTQARFINMWRKGPSQDLYDELRAQIDPIKQFRDDWLTTLLQTDEHRRLYNDFIDLWFSALTPSILTSRSDGLAAPLPFLEELVDFDKLPKTVKHIPGGHLCVNAYNLTKDAKTKPQRKLKFKRRMTEAASPDQVRAARRESHKEELEEVMEFFECPAPKGSRFELTAQGIRAAFSMPFIYPAAKIGDDYYSEGADHEPVNFRHVKNEPIVLLDVLAELEDYLVRRPRDLWDAYVISIMAPVVALAKMTIAEFKEDHPKTELNTISWDIPREAQPYVMDWSYSNLKTLFEVGHKAGHDFVDKHDHRLHEDPRWAVAKR